MEDGSYLLIELIIRVIFGAIAAAIANSKGRSAVGWFFGGFFLVLIGVIIVACLSNLREEQALRQRDQQEKRRLREQLRQERMKSETFRQYTMDRLDAHDRVLEIDTKGNQTGLALPEGQAAAETKFIIPGGPVPVPDGVQQQEDTTQWYYNRDGESSGPHSIREIEQLAAAGAIGRETLVWSEDLVEWTAAGSVPDLASTIRSAT